MRKIPPLLYTYLLTEMLAPFFAALLVINAILFLGRLVPLLEGIFSLGVGAADFTRLSLYLLPSLLRFSIPMAAMMAVIIAFTRMAGDMEIVALKAAGIGLPRMLPPVLFFGLLTGVATLLVGTVLIPQGTRAMNQLMIKLAGERIQQGVQPQTFSNELGKVVLYVEEIAPESRDWQGIYLTDLRRPKTPLTVVAASGSLGVEAGGGRAALTLHRGSLHRSSELKSQSIYFDRYTLELPLHSPALGQGGRHTMEQGELLAAAKALPPDHPQAIRLIIEYHQRLGLAVGCFLLCALGPALSRLGRESRLSLGIPAGLLAFIAYYLLLTGAKAVAEEGALPIFAPMWTPNLFFALLAACLLWRASHEQGNPWLEKITTLWQRLKSARGAYDSMAGKRRRKS